MVLFLVRFEVFKCECHFYDGCLQQSCQLSQILQMVPCKYPNLSVFQSTSLKIALIYMETFFMLNSTKYLPDCKMQPVSIRHANFHLIFLMVFLVKKNRCQ